MEYDKLNTGLGQGYDASRYSTTTRSGSVTSQIVGKHQRLDAGAPLKGDVQILNDVIENNLHELSLSLTALGEKMHPVLRPPAPANPVNGKSEYSSEVANKLCEHANRISALNETIKDLTTRLDL